MLLQCRTCIFAVSALFRIMVKLLKADQFTCMGNLCELQLQMQMQRGSTAHDFPFMYIFYQLAGPRCRSVTPHPFITYFGAANTALSTFPFIHRHKYIVNYKWTHFFVFTYLKQFWDAKNFFLSKRHAFKQAILTAMASFYYSFL